jgi:hypothetical protein
LLSCIVNNYPVVPQSTFRVDLSDCNTTSIDSKL